MLELDDLTTSIRELTGIVDPTLVFVKEAPGKRACPRCTRAMTACHLDVRLGGEHPKLRPELDRCEAHGIWFDTDELVKIFELLHRAVWKHGGGAGINYTGQIGRLKF